MSRVKISEYQAKSFLKEKLNLSWQGLKADKNTRASELKKLFPKKSIVVKVDQGIKKRAKHGLVVVDVDIEKAIDFIKTKTKQGFSQFLIEEFVPHQKQEEKYLSLERVREGIKILYSQKGGIEIETNWNLVKEKIVDCQDSSTLSLQFAKELKSFIKKLIDVFDKHYLSFLEINPLVVKGRKAHILDLAVEIDDAALNLPELAKIGFAKVVDIGISKAEQEVQKLDAKTPASLKFKLVDKNGSVWMLLSGGGASLVLADELSDLGYARLLANYGEYSGNPTSEDTYLYTRVILQQMLKSSSSKKVLVIAGGVANFTDITKTFVGVIQALKEYRKQMFDQGIKVYVRRGGPNQEKGLALMRDFLRENGIYGHVAGPEEELTEVIKRALAKIK